jgi:hypothetical protein
MHLGPDDSTGHRTVETVARGRARLHSDVGIAGAIVAFCIAAWIGTLMFDEVPAALTQGMGPGVFPRLLLAVMIVLAVWLALSSRGRADPEREPIRRTVLLTGAAGLAFLAVLQVLGIYGAIVFSFVGIGRLWGERRWPLLAAIAAIMVAVTHLAFTVGFGIALPHGLLGRWLD